MRKNGDRKKFDIHIYARSVAWKAFLKSKDPAVDAEDFIQEAYLALEEAARLYDPDRGASFITYSISQTIFRMHKLLRKRQKPVPVSCESVRPDDFWLRVEDVFSSLGNKKAKELLTCLLERYAELNRCTLVDLKKLSGMEEIEFRRALFQLSRY